MSSGNTTNPLYVHVVFFCPDNRSITNRSRCQQTETRLITIFSKKVSLKLVLVFTYPRGEELQSKTQFTNLKSVHRHLDLGLRPLNSSYKFYAFLFQLSIVWHKANSKWRLRLTFSIFSIISQVQYYVRLSSLSIPWAVWFKVNNSKSRRKTAGRFTFSLKLSQFPFASLSLRVWLKAISRCCIISSFTLLVYFHKSGARSSKSSVLSQAFFVSSQDCLSVGLHHAQTT